MRKLGCFIDRILFWGTDARLWRDISSELETVVVELNSGRCLSFNGDLLFGVSIAAIGAEANYPCWPLAAAD